MKLATRIFNRERCENASGDPNCYYLTSPFGKRIDPITHKVISFHNGCDYGTHSNKWPQYALEDGIVDNVFVDEYGAKDIWVRYPRLGYRCLHGHLDSFAVKKGQAVNHDTILGYTGMSGKATGIHLHLGVKYIDGSDWIDPESIDYNEGFTPFNGVVKKGSALYDANGKKYKNGASQDRKVEVRGELNNRYQVYGKTFNPHIVYVDKQNVVKVSDYPFPAIVKKGTYFYNAQGQRYKKPAQSSFKVQVQGELNGRYKIYASRLNPNIVYCNKQDIIR